MKRDKMKPHLSPYLCLQKGVDPLSFIMTDNNDLVSFSSFRSSKQP